MSRKRIYATQDIKCVHAAALLPALAGGCQVAIDVAKEKFVVAIGTSAGEMVRLVLFRHPIQTRRFLELLAELKAGGSPPTVLMEPTGTYGDAIRAQLAAAGHRVFMIQPKHTHDAMELMDGVPSMHDAKAAMTLLYMQKNGHSREWSPTDDDTRRDLRTLLNRCRMHGYDAERRYGMLEALLARHWPEFEAWLDPRRQRSALALLREFQCPEAVAADPSRAEKCLLTASRRQLSSLLIIGVIEDATRSLGVPMRASERLQMLDLVEEIERHERQVERLEQELISLIGPDPMMARLAKAGGPQVAAALISMLGSPKTYGSARAYLKAAGMNLREISSGTEKGAMHLTKRGPALVRQLVYLAALRWIGSDPVAKAWYVGRKTHQQDQKTSAVVAVMRKLLIGLYRVGKYDEEFDSTKLFDMRRLELMNTVTSRPRFGAARTERRSIARRSAKRRDQHQGGVQP